MDNAGDSVFLQMETIRRYRVAVLQGDHGVDLNTCWKKKRVYPKAPRVFQTQITSFLSFPDILVQPEIIMLQVMDSYHERSALKLIQPAPGTWS